MTAPGHHQRLLIVDFGSQVTQLIARRLREASIYCEIHPFKASTTPSSPRSAPSAVILSGGPASALEPGSPRAPESVFALGVPVLGICYGQQVMMVQLGGAVEGGHHREFGRAYVSPVDHAGHPIFEGLFAEGREEVWMSHGDRVTALARDSRCSAPPPARPARSSAIRRATSTPSSSTPRSTTPRTARASCANFTRIAGFTGDWTMAAYRDEAIAKIRAQVGTERVICGLSGGVDSSVAAVLIHEAIGDQLTCVFVDTGLLRLGEAEEVVRLFRDSYNIPLIHADESDRFLAALAGVSDPETKRKTIGGLFIEIFEKHAKDVGNAAFLAQGTLYPDVIESVSFTGGPSVTIKSHHNVGGLPERMNLRLVEPLRELFKDEVRALGRELGLPPISSAGTPSPAPASPSAAPARSPPRSSTSCAAPTPSTSTRSAATASTTRSGRPSPSSSRFAPSVSWATAAPTTTSARSRRHLVDGMTADYYPFDPRLPGETATRIINEVNGINRVTYDITSKPPGTIEWE
jgi:GMP synthase (glutamine-hydrolysing)